MARSHTKVLLVLMRGLRLVSCEGGGQVQKGHFLRLLVVLLCDITKVQVPGIICLLQVLHYLIRHA